MGVQGGRGANIFIFFIIRDRTFKHNYQYLFINQKVLGRKLQFFLEVIEEKSRGNQKNPRNFTSKYAICKPSKIIEVKFRGFLKITSGHI